MHMAAMLLYESSSSTLQQHNDKTSYLQLSIAKRCNYKLRSS